MEFASIKARLPARRADLLWAAVSLVLLFVCLYYSYIPASYSFNFTFTPSWEIKSAAPCPNPAQCLQAGDRLLTIGKIDHERYMNDRSIDLLDGFGRDGTATVLL
ncbi:MAG TPA: hypothetical protein VMM92_12380, partial [Thermoanaerobaculia bacterium]|nr:hypothetical protein [Thermoanaerobaculia bacterium]